MPDIFQPRTNNVRALITTKWDKRGYKPVRVNNIQEYWLDTALDNDSDQWSITLGDPADAFVNDLLRRDNEVRAQIYGIGVATQAIAGGIADEVKFSDDNTIIISGRDFSSLATDSVAPPREFRASLADRIVKAQAKEIHMPGPFNLRRGVVKKYQYTDGSETYWAFWHRLYRKDKMWIWCGPDGTLNAGKLNYGDNPAYYFGDAPSGASAAIRKKYVPVTSMTFTKNMQQRLANIWVYYHTGDNGKLLKETDPKTRGWLKRPRKILLDTDAHKQKGARKLAWEEFHDGTVGELEISVTIVDPGYLVRQNRIARVNLPDLGISGEFFVVGARVMANEGGFLQEVRMREKNYSISRRVPSDPKIAEAAPGRETSRNLGTTLTIDEGPQSWMPYFVRAAKEFHRPWDFELFLACLLGMCHVETHFRNIRSNGGPGGDGVQWYPWEVGSSGVSGQGIPTAGRDKHNRTLEQWRTVFANVPGQYVSQIYAVGPMQLYSPSFKEWADDYMRAGFHDQWKGGRWHPEHNIRAAARVLKNKLRETVGDTGKDQDIWAGVKAYNGAGSEAEAYKQNVKNAVYNNPGYLKSVQEAVKSARESNEPNPPLNTSGSVMGPQARGKVILAPGADRPGVKTKNVVLDMVAKIAYVYGKPLTITTGTNHRQYVNNKPSDGQSDHWDGYAADILMYGAALTKLGQAALITAGMNAAHARKQTGGVYNVGGWNILFNTTVGGNHWNHLHIGKSH